MVHKLDFNRQVRYYFLLHKISFTLLGKQQNTAKGFRKSYINFYKSFQIKCDHSIMYLSDVFLSHSNYGKCFPTQGKEIKMKFKPKPYLKQYYVLCIMYGPLHRVRIQ